MLTELFRLLLLFSHSNSSIQVDWFLMIQKHKYVLIQYVPGSARTRNLWHPKWKSVHFMFRTKNVCCLSGKYEILHTCSESVGSVDWSTLQWTCQTTALCVISGSSACYWHRPMWLTSEGDAKEKVSIGRSDQIIWLGPDALTLL